MRPLALALGAILALVAAPAAIAHHDAGRSHVQLAGGAADERFLCGAQRDAAIVPVGEAVRATVPPASTADGRAARRGSRLVVDRCQDGRWTRVSSAAVGATARAVTETMPTGRAATGDYRVRLQRRGGQAGRSAFLRVGAGEIVDVPVSFRVVNQNRTNVPCFGAPDGETYTVTGSLVAPRSLLRSGDPDVTLYYHGLSYAEFFFRFQAVPGYDYGLEQARDGHASVVVDRLGYPQSQGPDGNAVCYSAQADIADQIIGQLKRSDYTLQGGRGGFGFDRVALAGHSAGGFIAEMAQYSFGSADALVVMSYADQGASPLVLMTLTQTDLRCRTAPERAMGDSGPPNYAFFGQTEEDFRRGHIHNADPAVVDEVLKLRTRDPCGDIASIPPSFVFNQPLVRTITSPVLLVYGKQDAFFPPPAGSQQSGNYPGSSDVSLVELEETGHALTLGRTAPQFRAAMDAWLTQRGF